MSNQEPALVGLEGGTHTEIITAYCSNKVNAFLIETHKIALN